MMGSNDKPQDELAGICSRTLAVHTAKRHGSYSILEGLPKAGVPE